MGDGSGLWYMAALLSGSVGAGMLIYGIRQKAPLPLAFGVAVSIVPTLVGDGISAMALFAALVVAFLALRKRI